MHYRKKKKRREDRTPFASLGADAADTLLNAYNLALCLFNQGKHAETVVMAKEVLIAEQRINGPGWDHKNVQRAGSLLMTAQAAPLRAEREATSGH